MDRSEGSSWWEHPSVFARRHGRDDRDKRADTSVTAPSQQLRLLLLLGAALVRAFEHQQPDTGARLGFEISARSERCFSSP